MALATPNAEEVPEALQRLVRSIMRGFYTIEQCAVVDMLIYSTILREEELADRLQLDKRQVRQMLTSLKADKLIRTRMKIETDNEGKASRSNYYYIDYRLFVNVVKFKLDVMRRRLEADQRETTSRYSFRCPDCQKTFTDMDVQHLFDQATGTLLCTHCQHEVEEEEDQAGLADARALMLKYHEQVRKPVDDMLQKCEQLHLSTELQEPEFRQSTINGAGAAAKQNDAQKALGKGPWSGDHNRGMNFGASESSVTVVFANEGEEDGSAAGAGSRSGQQRPIWLRESTVEGAGTSADSVTQVTQQMAPGRAPSLNFAPTEDGSASKDEIMATLLLHEKRTARPSAVGRARGQQAKAAPTASSSDGDDSDASRADSDDDGGPVSKRSRHHGDNARDDNWFMDGEMEDDEEEEDEYVISFQGRALSYESVTQDMIRQMTTAEKEEYIEVGKRWYSDNYE